MIAASEGRSTESSLHAFTLRDAIKDGLPPDTALVHWSDALALEMRLRHAPSATAHGEGYPGIAHDFETMRTALCAIVGLSNVHHDLESAQEIASNAVRDLRSVDRKTP